MMTDEEKLTIAAIKYNDAKRSCDYCKHDKTFHWYKEERHPWFIWKKEVLVDKWICPFSSRCGSFHREGCWNGMLGPLPSDPDEYKVDLIKFYNIEYGQES